MKKTIQIIALFLSIVLIVFPCISCTKNDPESTLNGAPPEGLGQTASDQANGGSEKRYVFEVVYPLVSVSSLSFTLTDAHFTEYESKLLAAKSLFDKNEEGSDAAFKHALYELLSLQAKMDTQRDIAYIQYYYDMSDSVAWENYLYAYRLYDDAHDLFWDFYHEAQGKENHLLAVFEEVIQREYQGNLISVTPEADTYAYQMEVLEQEYNSLKNSGASDEKMFAAYKKYMQAAYGYAVSSGADHYYEYAHKNIDYRNDTAAQRDLLREYVKEYLVPLCRELRAKSKLYDQQLSRAEVTLSNQYLYSPYDSFSSDHLTDYFSSLSRSSGEAMKGAFEKDRVLIGEGDHSYNHAMVMMVGNTPICYFHEDRTTLETMSHELGHYYAHEVGDTTYASLDLRETHSTANTMLLYSYLSDTLNSKAFTAAELYMAYNWTYQIITSVIKDEFDERIYSSHPLMLKQADFERIMRELIAEYQVSDLSNGVVDQLMTYWRRNGIVYPMSNYCYATANIAAFQIYLKSKDDYAAASEIYRKIVEEPENGGDFLLTLSKAGLKTPYEEQTYRELQRLATLYEE